MEFKGIHHAAIICSNYEESKRFYTEILGLEVIREVYRKERDSYKLDLRVSNSQIELFSFNGSPERLSYPEACGLRHLALVVNNINESVKELNFKGVTTEDIRIDEFTNCKFTFFEDPDGLPIELYEINN
ncbi:SMU1112c/YaeR family gloxylase I-like metalloprotein [Clostridium sp.]|uniref:SMU1112c/YaeR family gloxylase I-like metalloprotein n=1 Tax=Clostridium sp. TaxID=1506 RepID=UPI002FC638B8